MFEAALGTAFCFMIVAFRFGIRRIAGYATAFDIFITVLLMWLFTGTYAGMMTGVIAGGLISIYLNIVRKTIGVERLRFVKEPGRRLPKWRWVHIPAREL